MAIEKRTEELLEIGKKHYMKLGSDLSVDGKIDTAELVLVLIFVVQRCFHFIFSNHGMKTGARLFGIFIDEVTKYIADGIKVNDGTHGVEIGSGSIEGDNL